MGIKSLVKQVLMEQQNRRYRKLLSDKTVTYEEWVAEQEARRWGLEGAVECDDPAREGTAVSFVVLCCGNGETSKKANKYIARYFMENPNAVLLYGDEDVWDENGVRRTPWFKPDWSPDLFDSCFYFGSLVAVRRALFEKIAREQTKENSGDKFLGAKKETIAAKETDGDGLQNLEYYEFTDLKRYVELVRSCVKSAGGYQRHCDAIGHFPGILYHVNEEQDWEQFVGVDSLLSDGTDPDGKAECDGFGTLPSVSVIIPSKDNPVILQKCVGACLATAYPHLEIIVVDNGSNSENRERIEEMTAIRYLYCPMEFNFSKMCNMGAEAAAGELLLFLNDDVELCQPECLKKMAEMAARDYTGAVGLKLYYPNSVKIQHAGITNLPMGPVHKLQFKENNECYYFGANHGCRNFLAVTAACLMVEKRKFQEVGGFCEEMRVAFNDVDICFGLYELGYHNVCVNDSYAYHHESLSRGEDESREKLERLLGERKKLYERHPSLEGVDPYYSVHLNRGGLDTSIRPTYETGCDETQLVSGGDGKCGQETARAVSKVSGNFNTEGYRQDNCLLLRVEDSREGRLIGYGVVLGDNNACYEKALLLKSEVSAKKTEVSDGKSEVLAGESATAVGNQGAEFQAEIEEQIFAVSIRGNYRVELAENMPDQENVALSGFDIRIGKGTVPAGRYLVGMAARNRVTGLKLINWSNRVVEL